MATVARFPVLRKAGAECSVEPPKLTRVAFDASTEDVTDLIQYLNDLSLQKSYEKLDIFLKVLSSPNTKDAVLTNWLKQLNDNISILDKENERIAGALLHLNWTSRSCEVASVYHKLMLNMISAHIFYLRPVLAMIIKQFSSVNENAQLENACYKRAHVLLQDVFVLFPGSTKVACLLIAENFPYFKKPCNAVLSYSMNALNVCTYIPADRLAILENLMDRYTQIDVHCPRSTIEMWELDKDDEQVQMEIDSDMTEDMAFPLANTLDLLMNGLFKFIECTCYCNGGKELSWVATKQLYNEVLSIFEKLILPTSRCCHVPFIMFYICSLYPALSEDFLDFLWKKVKNPTTAPDRRQIAAFYIGSLLARACYINMSTVTACFDLMCSWVHSYINNHDSFYNSDVGTHRTFYCVCQTLFYVFAFRHKEFIAMKNGFKYLRSLNFERIVTCRLNPLKFCQPIIVQNFASVARSYQVAYCYPIIERNNRSLILSVVNFPVLNTFFPFDPYLLKRSKKWIEAIYRVYDVQSDDDIIERDEDELLIERGGIQSMNEALFSYGSSPGFKDFEFLSPKR